MEKLQHISVSVQVMKESCTFGIELLCTGGIEEPEAHQRAQRRMSVWEIPSILSSSSSI